MDGEGGGGNANVSPALNNMEGLKEQIQKPTNCRLNFLSKPLDCIHPRLGHKIKVKLSLLNQLENFFISWTSVSIKIQICAKDHTI